MGYPEVADIYMQQVIKKCTQLSRTIEDMRSGIIGPGQPHELAAIATACQQKLRARGNLGNLRDNTGIKTPRLQRGLYTGIPKNRISELKEKENGAFIGFLLSGDLGLDI